VHAEAVYAAAWQRIRLVVDEHDLAGTVAAAKRLAVANRRLSTAQRALRAHQDATRTVETTGRTVILPPPTDDEGGRHGR
jgi:hypothetical protein